MRLNRMRLDSLLIPEIGARLRWIDLPGHLPARVYLHGLGGSAQDFLPAVEHPSLAGNRSLLVDLLGFGRSDRPDGFGYGVEDHASVVARLLDELHLDACEVIGHSLGATVAVALTAARTDLVSHLVVVEPRLTRTGGLSGWIAAQPEDVYVRAGHRLLVARWGESTDVASLAYRDTFASASPRAVYRSAVAAVCQSAPDRCEVFLRLAVRRAYLVGERRLPDHTAEVAAAHGIPVLVVPDAGHLVMTDATKEFAITLATALRAG